MRTRERVTWNTLPVPERVQIAVAAGLPGKTGSAAWSAIHPAMRQNLLDYFTRQGWRWRLKGGT